MVKNIMSVDLEDYFCDLPLSEWEHYESRVVENTEVLLNLFEKHNTKVTFFVLGYVAKKFPSLIKRILDLGHEIASHGYAHLDIRKVTKSEFEADLEKSLSILESTVGSKILGFRAPFFSIDKNTLWALDILRKCVSYDSSIFPVHTPLYGIPDAPRFFYHPSTLNPLEDEPAETFVELPPVTHHIPLIGNIPIAGGFHLRFLPYFYLAHGIRKYNKLKKSAMCYIHPKDLDPKMPRIKNYSWHYYYGLKNSYKKFEKLFSEFTFTTARSFLKL